MLDLVQIWGIFRCLTFSFLVDLINTWELQSKNLGEESSRYWHVIMNQSYQFTRLQDIAQHVKTLTKDRVLRFFDKYVALNAPCRHKLCVHVFAKQHQERMGQKAKLEGVDADNVVIVNSPVEFKRSMPLFPLAKQVDVSVASVPSKKE